MELPLASVGKLIRKAGADRVSEDAAKELGKLLEEISINVAREAVTLARHAGRRTVKVEDIRLAGRPRPLHGYIPPPERGCRLRHGYTLPSSEKN